MSDHLFVYGTLLPDRAPYEIADIVKDFKRLGRGTIQGKLYNLGAYPGVVLDTRSKERIEGDIFVLPPSPEALACLDEYEEYRPNDPERSLFTRQRVQVTFQNGSRLLCWIYVYNKNHRGRAAHI